MRKLCVAMIMILGLSSCQICYSSSPSVKVKNISDDGSLIRNIKIVWNGYHLLDIPGPMNSCGSGGFQQSFTLLKKSDLFGPVHAEWQNAKGEKVSKDFIFKEEDLPSYAKGKKYGRFEYPSIILFFTQSDVEYYTSDNPRLKQIEEEKRGNWINKWFEEEKDHRCVNDPKEAARFKYK